MSNPNNNNKSNTEKKFEENVELQNRFYKKDFPKFLKRLEDVLSVVEKREEKEQKVETSLFEGTGGQNVKKAMDVLRWMRYTEHEIMSMGAKDIVKEANERLKKIDELRP